MRFEISSVVQASERERSAKVEGNVNHALSLTLILLEQLTWGFRFQVTVRNESGVNLLLPIPQETGLRFGSTATHLEAAWYTTCFVSAVSNGIVLQPGKSWSDEWRVGIRHPSIEWSLKEVGNAPSLDWRFRFELTPGTYLVWWQWSVGNDFFDPDTHQTISDLENLAKQAGAVVWRGQALSNRFQVVYAEPDAASAPAV
jgi:hypothetical protein